MKRFWLVLAALLTAMILVASGRPAPAAESGANGYWLVAADGGVFAFGDAEFYGSMGGLPLNAPIVGMSSTAAGDGYWLVAADGGVFAFGAAEFVGSAGFYGTDLGRKLRAPVVGMSVAANHGDTHYWLTDARGLVTDIEYMVSGEWYPYDDYQSEEFVGIAVLGAGESLALVDARNCFSGTASPIIGETPHVCVPSDETIVAIAATPSGNGFVTIGSRASNYPYGDASKFLGPASIIPNLNAPVVGGALCGSDGIWYAAADGGVFAFGPAQFHGSLGNVRLNAPIVGMAGICN